MPRLPRSRPHHAELHADRDLAEIWRRLGPDADDSEPEATAPRSVQIELSPTQAAFVTTDVEVPIAYGRRGCGKMCANGTPVLTPTGWVKIEDLAVGDRVIAGDGSWTDVVGVFPQGVLPLWRLLFSDGASAVVGDEHLWAIETSWDRGGYRHYSHPRGVRPLCDDGGVRRRPWEPRPGRRRRPMGLPVVTTAEIRARLDGTGWRHGGRWSVPRVGAVRFPSQPVPLDPYLLGVLIGDGGFSAARAGVTLTTADADLADVIASRLPSGVRMVPGRRYAYRISGNGRVGGNAVRAALADLGLFGHRSDTKFVPDCYLWNTADVRVAVLQGLLDTDGTVSATGSHVSFTSTSEQLARDVIFLVRSLGGMAHVTSRFPRYRVRDQQRLGRIAYTVEISLPPGVMPFRLARKARRVRPRSRRGLTRYITGYESAGEGAATCIQVAHPSALYVIHDFVVTHNSLAAVVRIIRLAQDYPHARPLRVAVIRDTFVNLQRSVRVTLEEGHARGYWRAQFGNGGRECLLNDGLAQLWLLGMDNEKDASDFQGFVAGVAWLDEPAPAADLQSGIPVSVFALALSSLRQRGAPGSIMITMNPPDRDHWPLWTGTPILTPSGWIALGEISVGDQVIAADGRPTTVTGVFPRGRQPLYRVGFSDGVSILATPDHPWAIESKWDRRRRSQGHPCRSFRVVTTAEIRERLDARRGMQPYRWSIPLCLPVQFPHQPVPLDPYVLGVLLGDGGMTTGEVKLCSADPEILEQVQRGLPPRTFIRHLRSYDYVILSEGGRGTPNPVNRAIKSLALDGCRALTKFVPAIYLWNSPEVRLALLQGLLDTDGSASPHGNGVSFTSISERLIGAVEFLVRSLGGITRHRAARAPGPGRPHATYTIGVVLPDHVAPFRLSRKNARLRPRSARHQPARYLVSCERVGEDDAACLSIADPGRLFLCEHFVTTHNTLNVAEQLRALSRPEMRCEVFRFGNEENVDKVPPGYLERMRLGFEAAGREDLVKRLVEGNVGTVQLGYAVTPGFGDAHIYRGKDGQPARVPVNRRWPAYIGIDYGGHPGFVIAQRSPLGYLYISAARVGENMGIEDLFEQHFFPLLHTLGLDDPPEARRRDRDGYDTGHSARDAGLPHMQMPPAEPTASRLVGTPLYAATLRVRWEAFGDPAGNTPEQTRSERTAKRAVERMLGVEVRPGPVSWAARREALHMALSRSIRGVPMLQIDELEADVLVHGLQGAWHYRRLPGGKRGYLPEKDLFSHCGDALSYMLARLFNVTDMMMRGRWRERPVVHGPKETPDTWMGV